MPGATAPGEAPRQGGGQRHLLPRPRRPLPRPVPEEHPRARSRPLVRWRRRIRPRRASLLDGRPLPPQYSLPAGDRAPPAAEDRSADAEDRAPGGGRDELAVLSARSARGTPPGASGTAGKSSGRSPGGSGAPPGGSRRSPGASRPSPDASGPPPAASGTSPGTSRSSPGASKTVESLPRRVESHFPRPKSRAARVKSKIPRMKSLPGSVESYFPRMESRPGRMRSRPGRVMEDFSRVPQDFSRVAEDFPEVPGDFSGVGAEYKRARFFPGSAGVPPAGRMNAVVGVVAGGSDLELKLPIGSLPPGRAEGWGWGEDRRGVGPGYAFIHSSIFGCGVAAGGTSRETLVEDLARVSSGVPGTPLGRGWRSSSCYG